MIGALQRLIADALRRHEVRDHLQLLTGKITAVDTTNKRCSVKLRAEATATANVAYISSLTLAVDNDVYVLMSGSRSYLVIGLAHLPVSS